MDEFNLERAQREDARWRILQALNAGRPGALSETIIFRTLSDVQLPFTHRELRRELTYLEEKEFIRILHRDQATWLAELTAFGIDVVEYTTSIPPKGIGRPNKF